MKDDEPWRDDYLVFGAPALGAEEQAEVIACMQSGWVGSGPRVAEFERRLADYLAAPAVVAVNSCTAALHLALRVLDLPPGAEVITTAMTFCATANVIVHAGYEPVFADCDRATLNLDPDDVRRRLTPRTRAILPVHFAGRPCDLAALGRIAEEHGLAIVEDAAHALEATIDGRHCGTFGDFGCFSFYVTKSLTTVEGGLVAVRDPRAAARIKTLALHGMSADAWKRYSDEGFVHYEVLEPGFKYNLTDLAAAIGLRHLDGLEARWARRPGDLAILRGRAGRVAAAAAGAAGPGDATRAAPLHLSRRRHADVGDARPSPHAPARAAHRRRRALPRGPRAPLLPRTLRRAHRPPAERGVGERAHLLPAARRRDDRRRRGRRGAGVAAHLPMSAP